MQARIRGAGWPAAICAAGMLGAILLVLAVRIWRLDVPFERDEGEYAYMGQLMLQGTPPYGIAANMKLPGTHAAYALTMAVFGQTVRGVRLGFLLVNAGAILLLYLLTRRWLGWLAGVAAAASYAVLAVGATVDGLWAHATHFVVLCALGATLLLVRWADRGGAWTLAGSGFLYGLAVLMKQPGVLFAVFGACYLAWVRWKQPRALARDLAVFGAAAALPLAMTAALLWRAGVFGRFWFWVFTYARQYVSIEPVSKGWENLLLGAAPIAEFNWALCLLAAAGAVVLGTRKELRPAALAAGGFLVFSFLAVCPGLYFRPHYFVLVLPAVGVVIGAFARSAGATLAGSLPLWLILGGLANSLWVQRGYLVRMTPTQVLRGVYSLSPFPEAVPVAEYIRAHSTSEDRVAILGSEPEIYFYAHRRSATPYLYMGPLLEPHPLAPQMLEEYIDDVSMGRPKFFVYASRPTTWNFLPDSPEASQGLVGWGRRYAKEYYDVVGVADITEDGTVYKWDEEAAHYRIGSADFVMVMRRK